MQVQELTKKIHDDFSKTWKKITKYFEKYEEYGIVFGNKSQFCIFMHNDLSELCLIPFSILYGLLEDFFEENGIDIEIRNVIMYFEYQLFDIKTGDFLFENDLDFKNKREAKEQAILKVCEILEKSLQNV